MKKIILQRGKEKSLQRFHPWVFSGAVQKQEGDPGDGDIVEVMDANDQYLATGHFYHSSIAVRIFSFERIVPTAQFWKGRISDALNLRRILGLFRNPRTNMFRLVNGEGDMLPGLIIDWFNGNLVLQFHSYGMYLLKDTFVDILKELLGDQVRSIYNKSALTMPELEGRHFEDELLYGTIDEVMVKENGHEFYIDILQGQKTGFFIDQRESRELVGNYAEGKHVLNLFCYTGGFSVYAASGGAKEVHSVDISKKAIEYTEKNITLVEGRVAHRSFAGNVFDYLDTMPADFYDLIILDPPAFAKHHKVKEQGIKGYRNINRKALEKIRKGGLLFTFSCSQAISRDDFQTLLFSAAVLERRDVRVIKSLQQSVDHPVNIYHPEGSYLKGFMLYVN